MVYVISTCFEYQPCTYSRTNSDLHRDDGDILVLTTPRCRVIPKILTASIICDHVLCFGYWRWVSCATFSTAKGPVCYYSLVISLALLYSLHVNFIHQPAAKVLQESVEAKCHSYITTCLQNVIQMIKLDIDWKLLQKESRTTTLIAYMGHIEVNVSGW